MSFIESLFSEKDLDISFLSPIWFSVAPCKDLARIDHRDEWLKSKERLKLDLVCSVRIFTFQKWTAIFHEPVLAHTPLCRLTTQKRIITAATKENGNFFSNRIDYRVPKILIFRLGAYLFVLRLFKWPKNAVYAV